MFDGESALVVSTFSHVVKVKLQPVALRNVCVPRVHTELSERNLDVGSSICSERSTKALKLQTLVTLNEFKAKVKSVLETEIGMFSFF